LYRENYHDSPPFFHQFSRTVCPSSAGQLMPSTGGHYVLAVTLKKRVPIRVFTAGHPSYLFCVFVFVSAYPIGALSVYTFETVEVTY
ncbi:hypothetical protein M4D58_26455, partial [Brevibacillus borstelensis]|uniref:hypothetical protein n=1 Tax=Brevibacillus borstelensis TaxID=45462 RepID=UPI00203E8531